MIDQIIDMSGLCDRWLDWMGVLQQSGERDNLKRKLSDYLACSDREHVAWPWKDAGEDSREPKGKPLLDLQFRQWAEDLGVAPAPFWPESAPYALAVTHDVDRVRRTYQGLKNQLGQGRPLKAVKTLVADVMSKSSKNAYWNFDDILLFCRELDIQNTLYFLREAPCLSALFQGEPQHYFSVYDMDSPDIQDVIKRLESAGHEIGVHGSIESAASLEALKTEYKGVRQILKEPLPLGIRQHYLRHVGKEGFQNQHEAGFLYDTSMGFNFMNGFRFGTCFPYRAAGELIEIPFVFMDTAAMMESKETGQSMQSILKQVMGQVKAVGGICVLVWHQRFVSQEHEPELWEMMFNSVKQAKEDGAWITPLRDAAKWWQGRMKS